MTMRGWRWQWLWWWQCQQPRKSAMCVSTLRWTDRNIEMCLLSEVTGSLNCFYWSITNTIKYINLKCIAQRVCIPLCSQHSCQDTDHIQHPEGSLIQLPSQYPTGPQKEPLFWLYHHRLAVLVLTPHINRITQHTDFDLASFAQALCLHSLFFALSYSSSRFAYTTFWGVSRDSYTPEVT